MKMDIEQKINVAKNLPTLLHVIPDMGPQNEVGVINGVTTVCVVQRTLSTCTLP